MPALRSLLSLLDKLLEPAEFHDSCPNGLQVPGSSEVNRIVTAVSATAELFERAIEEQANLILVHHGLFWGSQPQAIDAPMKQRLKLLFEGDVSLAAYHLPLDAHPEVGNNALIARALGAEEMQPFAMHHGRSIGYIARFPDDGIAASELFESIAALTERESLVFEAGPSRVRSLAIVSGGGCSYLKDAIASGTDAFLTGEPAERVMSEARESHIHFIAAGHYATETFGVRRLGELLSERFGVTHAFIDLPNPV